MYVCEGVDLSVCCKCGQCKHLKSYVKSYKSLNFSVGLYGGMCERHVYTGTCQSESIIYCSGAVLPFLNLLKKSFSETVTVSERLQWVRCDHALSCVCLQQVSREVCVCVCR